MVKCQERDLSRREARDLDVEIGFLEGVLRRDPNYVEALEALGDNYTTRGRHRDCLQVDRRLCQLRPADPNVHFNLACSLALAEQHEDACKALEAALDRGFRDLRSLQRDPDLAETRKHPAYKGVREKIRTLRSKRAA